jgi:predicted Zn-dependent peptidase
MGWPILGDEETVGGFSRAHLTTHMGDNYRAGGMTLIASGAVEHAALVRLAEEKFARLTSGGAPKAEPAIYRGGEHREIEDLEQVHVAYAFPGVTASDPDFYTAQVYSMALGGGMSSRLFQEAREKRGLCYTIYSFAQSFADGGTLGIYAGTGAREAEDISAVVAGEMAALAANATDQEVSRAKAQLRSSLLMGLERPSARAEQIAGQLLAYGRVVPIAELNEKLEAVDAAAVRRFGERIMASGNPSMAALGPVERLESYDAFSNRFGAHRRAAE